VAALGRQEAAADHLDQDGHPVVVAVQRIHGCGELDPPPPAARIVGDACARPTTCLGGTHQGSVTRGTGRQIPKTRGYRGLFLWKSFATTGQRL
jgi:hypothetical protein